MWLFHPAIDLSMLLVPLAVTAVAWGISAARDIHAPHAVAGWLSQFVLGNTTHVILTFLLLATRRDVLHATRGQAALVTAGSLATVAVTFTGFWLLDHRYRAMTDLGMGAALVFATHHARAQVKGFWSLYNLRGLGQGVKPGEGERAVMQNFVAISLLFTVLRVFFVAKDPRASAPSFINVLPGEPAIVGYGASYPMLAAWLAYGAWVLRATLQTPLKSWTKTLYVGVHLLVVAVTMVAPGWGAIATAGIHGLEYYAISGRMLWPLPGEARGWFKGALVAPAMLLAMAPIFVVGLFASPFSSALTSAPIASLLGLSGSVGDALSLVNAVVMAHYFADAFIYRFRIPEVRRVALARLGF